MRYAIPLIVLLSMLFGCSQVPKPSTYPLTFQKKMQAADHWNLLARDVAEQVRICCSEREGCELGHGRPLYVEPKPGVFGRAFRRLLIAHLVRPEAQGAIQRSGCLVAEEKTADCLVLRYDVQLIKHRTNRFNRPMPGAFTALAAGLSVIRNNSPDTLKAWGIGAGVLTDIWVGAAATLPHHEVLITTSIVQDNQYLFSKADLYYINDPDFWHYPTQQTPGVRFMVENDVCEVADAGAGILDEDGDGVPDHRDQCPGTPAGARVDAQGCEPAQAPCEEKVVTERVVEEKPVPGPIVYFELDRTEVTSPYREELEAFADVMKRHPDYDILVVGHADNRGAVGYNETLSLNRARAVMDLLQSFGLPRHRIRIYGSGEITTVDRGGAHLDRDVNRRAMVKVQAAGTTL